MSGRRRARLARCRPPLFARASLPGRSISALNCAETESVTPTGGDQLSVALLAYRGNPRSGGQGVYVRHLSRELVALGHRVTVFAGRPYPDLDEGVLLERLPSLDLYRDSGPFRVPRVREIVGPDDAVELATMFAGGFAEPRAFARRARAALRARTGSFDVVHDNQGLGTALLDLVDDGWPVLAS